MHYEGKWIDDLSIAILYLAISFLFLYSIYVLVIA